MRLLLDTHVLLWWLSNRPELQGTAQAAIADAANVVYVSAASLWEISIKRQAGKLRTPEGIISVLRGFDFQGLPIALEHAAAVETLPEIHNDPFDRMLIAQAKVEGMVLVTHDQVIAKYPVQVLMT